MVGVVTHGGVRAEVAVDAQEMMLIDAAACFTFTLSFRVCVCARLIFSLIVGLLYGSFSLHQHLCPFSDGESAHAHAHAHAHINSNTTGSNSGRKFPV